MIKLKGIITIKEAIKINGTIKKKLKGMITMKGGKIKIQRQYIFG